jgi:hypothetical protein
VFVVVKVEQTHHRDRQSKKMTQPAGIERIAMRAFVVSFIVEAFFFGCGH